MARFLKDAQPKTEINDDRIQKVLSYIRKNIYKTIDIDSLAAISCLSKDHFQKRNKQHTIAIHQPKENRKSTAYIDNRQYAGKEHILSAGL